MTKIKLPHVRLGAQLAATDANRESRTVGVVAYSGAEVLQFSFDRGLHLLTLSLDPKAVNLARLADGAAFTKGHADPNNVDAVIGKVLNARVTGGKLRADVQFSRNHPDADRLLSEVIDGNLTSVSVEAAIQRMHETTKEGDRAEGHLRSFIADLWTPTAVALVAQGADEGARITAAAEQFSECEVEFSAATAALGDKMLETTEKNNGSTQSTAATTNPDATWIRQAAKSQNLVAFGEDLIARNIGKHEAGEAILNKVAEQSSSQIRQAHGEVIRDHRTGLADAMAESLACRYTGKAPSDRAREYMGASIADMARVCVEAAGVPSVGFGAERYIKLALHSTSDFPHLLQDSGSRMLLAAYAVTTPALQRVARRSTASDFRTKSMLRLGNAPKLIKVPESGEVTSGSRGEAMESYRIYSFARIFGITREALVNDDLGAFADFARAYGQAARNLEAQELTDLLYGATGYGPAMHDTVALFDVSHDNLATAPGAISDATLSAARLALRTTVDVDNETIIDTAPRYLIVPAALETVAEKYLATLYPAQTADVNVFSGKLELTVEPRLDFKSTTGWYIFGDPGVVPILEYSYLSGAEGPQIDSRQGFEVLGTEFRCVLDFGVGAIGWRGAWKGDN
jgi:hypothetical protein